MLTQKKRSLERSWLQIQRLWRETTSSLIRTYRHFMQTRQTYLSSVSPSIAAMLSELWQNRSWTRTKRLKFRTYSTETALNERFDILAVTVMMPKTSHSKLCLCSAYCRSQFQVHHKPWSQSIADPLKLVRVRTSRWRSPGDTAWKAAREKFNGVGENGIGAVGDQRLTACTCYT